MSIQAGGGYPSFDIHSFCTTEQTARGIDPDIMKKIETLLNNPPIKDLLETLRNTGVDIQQQVEADASGTFTASQVRDTLAVQDSKILKVVKQIKESLMQQLTPEVNAGKVTSDQLDQFLNDMQDKMPELVHARMAMSNWQQAKSTSIFDVMKAEHEKAVKVKIAEQLLITTMALQLKATPPSILSPSDYFDPVVNPFANRGDTHIDNGGPTPNNNWWSFFGSRMCAGNLLLRIVPDSQKSLATDPKVAITESEYREIYKSMSALNPSLPPPDSVALQPNNQYPPNDLRDYPVVSIPYSLAFQPSVDTGSWYVKNNEHGLQFKTGDQFGWTSGETSVYQSDTIPSIIAGATQDFSFDPHVTAHSDFSSTVQYETYDKTGKMIAYETQGDPYQTMVYSGNVTPYFNFEQPGGGNQGLQEGWNIDLNSIRAYNYDSSGKLVPTTGPPWHGKVITFSTKGNPALGVPPQVFRMYLSKETYFKPAGYLEKTVLPDDAYNALTDAQKKQGNYISMTDAAKYTNPHDGSHLRPYGTVMIPDNASDGVSRGLVACDANENPMTVGSPPLTIRMAHVPSPGPLPAPAAKWDPAKTKQEMLTQIADYMKNFGATTGDYKLFNEFKEVLNSSAFSKIPDDQKLAYLQKWAVNLLGRTDKPIGLKLTTEASRLKFYQIAGIAIPDSLADSVKTAMGKYQPGTAEYKLFNELYALLTNPAGEPYTASSADLSAWLQKLMNSDFGDYVVDGKGPGADAISAFMSLMAPYRQIPDPVETLDAHASTIVTSGTAEITGAGTWTYHYETTQMQPPLNPAQKTPPPALVGLLHPDTESLQNGVKNSLSYNSINGAIQEYELSADNTLTFQTKPLSTDPYADMSIPAGTSASDLVKLAQHLIDEANTTTIPSQGAVETDAMYDQGMLTQRVAQLALYLNYLLKTNPNAFSPQMTTQIEAARDHAVKTAESSLEYMLESGAYVYDETMGGMVTRNGIYNKGLDYSNPLYVDHHFSAGYAISAFALVTELDRKWATPDRIDRITCIVEDVANPEHNKNFPYPARNYDWWKGHSWANGIQDPTGSGSNEESSIEDLGFWHAVGMLGHEIGNKTFEDMGATLGARTATSAQAFWQVDSTESASAQTYFPGFNPDGTLIHTLGNLWTTQQTTATFFTPEGCSNPEVFLAGIEAIGTFPSMTNAMLDPAWAQSVFDDLINKTDFSKSSIFQLTDILKAKLQGQAVNGIAIFIPILIPLIAKISPIAAQKILDWYAQANKIDPGNFPWHNSATYGSLEFAILSQKGANPAGWTDPLEGQTLTLPPLPLPSVTPPGSGVPSKAEVMLSNALNAPASPLMKALIDQIKSLGPHATLKDIQDWAQKVVDSGQYSPTAEQMAQFLSVTGVHLPPKAPVADLQKAVSDWVESHIPHTALLYSKLTGVLNTIPFNSFQLLSELNGDASAVPDFYVQCFNADTQSTITPEDLAQLFSICGLTPMPPAPTAMDNALISASKAYAAQTDPAAKKFLADYMALFRGQTSLVPIQNFLKQQISNNFSAYSGLSPILKIMAASWAQLPTTGNLFQYPQNAASDFSAFLPQLRAQADAWLDSLKANPQSDAYKLAKLLDDYVKGTPSPANFTDFNSWVANAVMNNQSDLLQAFPGLSEADAVVFLNMIEPDGHLAYVNPQDRLLTAQKNSAEDIYSSYQNVYAYQLNREQSLAWQIISAIDNGNSVFAKAGTTIFNVIPPANNTVIPPIPAGNTKTAWELWGTGPQPPPYPTDRAGWENLQKFLNQFKKYFDDAQTNNPTPQSWIDHAKQWGIKYADSDSASKAIGQLYGVLMTFMGNNSPIVVNFTNPGSVLDDITHWKNALDLQGKLMEKLAELNSKGGNLQDVFNWAYSIDLSAYDKDLAPFATEIQNLQTLIHDQYNNLFVHWGDRSFNPHQGDPAYPLPNPGAFTPLQNALNPDILKNMHDYFANCLNKLSQELNDPSFAANGIQYAKEWGLSGTDAQTIKTQMTALQGSFQKGVDTTQTEMTQLKNNPLPDYINNFLSQTGMMNNSLNTAPFAGKMADVQKDIAAYTEGTTEHTAFQMIVNELLFMNMFNMTPADLKTWGTTILKNHPDFLAMDPAALKEFCRITGAEMPAPPSDLVDKIVTNIKSWESQFPVGSGEYKFAEAIITYLQGATPAPASLQDALNQIQQHVINAGLAQTPKVDVYLQYLGLTEKEIQGLDQSLISAIDQTAKMPEIPQRTKTDIAYLQVTQWQTDPKNNSYDTDLAKTTLAAFDAFIKQYGSDLDDTNDDNWQKGIASWAQNLVKTYKDTPNLSDYGKAQFAEITGISFPAPPVGPTLADYIKDLQAWKSAHPNSPALPFVDAVIVQFQEAINEKLTIPQAIQRVQNFIYDMKMPGNIPNDIYLQFPGIQRSMIQELSQDIFKGKFSFPDPGDPTPLDTLFTQAYSFLQTNPNVTDGDRALFQNALFYEIKNTLGSQGSMASLTDWANKQVIDPDGAFHSLFAGASAIGQQKFIDLTHATPPPHDYIPDLINSIRSWANNFPGISPQNQLGQAIILELERIEGSNLDLAGVIKDIQDNVFNKMAPKDVYLQFLGLQSSDIQELDQILIKNVDPKAGLPVPTQTDVDKKYADMMSWFNEVSKGNNTYDIELATELKTKFTDYINNYGSDPNNTHWQEIVSWAQGIVNTDGGFPYTTDAAKIKFSELTGSEPLQRYVYQLNKWLSDNSIASGSGTWNFVQDLIKEFKGLEGVWPPNTFAAAREKIIQDMLSGNANPDDIYLRYFGLQESQVQDLFTKIINDPGTGSSLPPTPMTDMDHIYTELRLGTFSGPDDALRQKLLQQILAYGSSAKSEIQFTQWMQNLIDSDDPLFTSCSFAMQSQVAGLTKTDILKHYTDRLNTWKSSLPAGSGAANLIVDILKQISTLEGQSPPKTLNDLIGAVDKFIYPLQNAQDIYMRYGGVTQADVQHLSSLLSIPQKSLDIPAATKMDQMFTAAYNWFHDPKTPATDTGLAKELMDELLGEGSDDANLAKLYTWAKGVMDPTKSPPDKNWIQASTAGKAQFEAITNQTPDPILTLMASVQKWMGAFGPNSPEYALGTAILNKLHDLQGQTPEPNLQQICSILQKEVFTQGNQDVYMFYGVKGEDMTSLSQEVFSGVLSVPLFTQMDKQYVQALAWKARAIGPGADIAAKLLEEIKTLGSYGDFKALQTWGYGIIDADPEWINCSADSKIDFATLTSTEPLQRYINAIQKWMGGFAPGSPEYKAGTFLITQLEGQEGAAPSKIFANIAQQLQDTFFSNQNLKDIYLQFPGFSEDSVTNLFKLLQDPGTNARLTPLPMTHLDSLYLQLQEKEKDPALTPADKALIQNLESRILNQFGSFNMNGMTAWAQGLIDADNSLFTNASWGIQSFFAGQTHTDILKHYTKRLSDWVQQIGTGPLAIGAAQLGENIIGLINQLEGATPPKTLHDLLAAFGQNIFTTKDGKDIYMQFPGLSDDQMLHIQSLLSLPQEKMPIPARTPMDTLFYNAYAWLNSGLSGPDNALATALWTQLYPDKKSSDSVDPLKAWGKEFLDSATFKGASPAAQAEFCKILGITAPSSFATILAEMEAYLKQRQGDYASLMDKLTKEGAFKYGKPANTPASWQKFIQQSRSIFKNQPGILKDIEAAGSAFSAVQLFQNVVNEINTLIKTQGATLDDLKKWAQGINLDAFNPPLSDADRKEFNLLLQLP